MNKTILGVVLSLAIGIAGTWLLKPAKLIPGKPYPVKGNTEYVTDSAAYYSIKAKYDSVLWELERAEKEAPPMPDTCKGVVEYWKKQLSSLKINYAECQNALSAQIQTSSGKRVFIDTLANWFVIRGIVPFPVGEITLIPSYLRKPVWQQERIQIGLSLPLWDWPSLRGLVRVKDTWWLGLGVSPYIQDGDWLTKYSVELSYSFMRF